MIGGKKCLSTLYAAHFVGYSVNAILWWHHHGCHLIGGEKLQLMHREDHCLRGSRGSAPMFFWAIDDLKRIKLARVAAIQAGWSGRGPLPPECLPPAGDDQPKANGQTAPPPVAAIESKPSDEAMSAWYTRKPSLKRNLLWLVKDAEFEADGVDDRCAAIRDWWNALEVDERAETGLRGRIAKGKNGSSVVRRGLAAARAFLEEQGAKI
ncbi:MAG: hypothetical protein IIA67_08015 [Planctomycetes bacterium]|nr:hypothetical protein [Planctomycetota bacterium]